MPRMSILTTNEQEAFESPLVSNVAERKRFFDTPLGPNLAAPD